MFLKFLFFTLNYLFIDLLTIYLYVFFTILIILVILKNYILKNYIYCYFKCLTISLNSNTKYYLSLLKMSFME